MKCRSWAQKSITYKYITYMYITYKVLHTRILHTYTPSSFFPIKTQAMRCVAKTRHYKDRWIPVQQAQNFVVYHAEVKIHFINRRLLLFTY